MIFCVEDDGSIRELVVYTLKNTGFEARGFENGALFFNAIKYELPELVLLDIMLPDSDGISILRQLKSSDATKNIPVIMLTAKSGEYDKVIGLDSGADDYIAKPFGMMELVSRIKAVMRRVAPPVSSDTFTCGDVTLSVKKHIVTVKGEAVVLTLKEFELLHLLMKSSGAVLTRDFLLESIWGYDFDGETRTVDVHIRTLRQKLGSSENIIETIRGVGYCIRETV